MYDLIVCMHYLQLPNISYAYLLQNDIEMLKSLATKWLSVAQKVIVELHESIPEPRPSLTEFLDHLQLDHSLIGFNADDESFE